MSSQISTTSINQNYPVAGVDNNSQGFRDNFTSIKNNFTIAAREINDLLDKVVVKTPLTYGTTPTDTSNDFADSEIVAAAFRDCSLTTVNLGSVTSGNTATVIYSNGSYQKLAMTSTSGNSTLSLTDWSTSDLKADLHLSVTVSNIGQTLVFDTTSTTFNNTVTLPGYNPLLNELSFASTGTFDLLFSTVDAGANVSVTDLSHRPMAVSLNSAATITNAALQSTGLTFNAHANVVYQFNADVFFTSSAADTQEHTISVTTGNSAATTIAYTVEQQAGPGSSFVANTSTTSSSLNSTVTTTSTDTKLARITGLVKITENSNVAITANCNVGTLTINSLSSIKYTPLI